MLMQCSGAAHALRLAPPEGIKMRSASQPGQSASSLLLPRPRLLKSPQGMGMLHLAMAFSRCLLSLSQKL
jgi:hypothetical protein